MIKEVIAHIEANKEKYIERLSEFLRMESISTDPTKQDDIRKCANWVQGVFSDSGFKTQIVETKKHPCVLADTGETGSGPVALVYGHYDVQPVGDTSLWDSPAFEPTIRDGSIFARGSADDKGQVFTHMLAAEAWKKIAGKLPVQIKFMVEGEEEIGSPNLEEVIREHADRLACDYIAISDTAKFDDDTPAITYGTKGMVYKEIIVTGPKQNLHSGSYGGSLLNPGNVLASIIASLKDGDNRVTIPGYYDDVQEISDDERNKLKALPFDEKAYLESMGAPALEGEKGYSTIERRGVRPTLDVNGMLGGFVGEGASTVIPAKVMAKVSMRIVPNQDPEKISQSFDAAVRAATPAGVRVEIITHAICGAYVTPLDSPGIRAAASAIEAGFGKKPLFIREGGSLPILPLFKEVLGADSLMMGFSVPGCNLHGPNEFFGIDDFMRGIKSSAYFMQELASCK